jgi:hypothetical protein
MLGILSIKDQLETLAQMMKNVMVKELAVMPDGAKENQDHQKIKIINMINHLLRTNVM